MTSEKSVRCERGPKARFTITLCMRINEYDYAKKRVYFLWIRHSDQHSLHGVSVVAFRESGQALFLAFYGVEGAYDGTRAR